MEENREIEIDLRKIFIMLKKKVAIILLLHLSVQHLQAALLTFLLNLNTHQASAFMLITTTITL